MKNYRDYLVAVIDDEPDILDLVSSTLQKSGFRTMEFSNASDFENYLMQDESPDLIILDIMLPDSDGLDICRRLKYGKKYSNIPIIILSALKEDHDKIIGLELGADDYITKPFSPRELVTRVKVVLRRFELSTEQDVIELDENIRIIPGQYRILKNGKPLNMTSTEFRILTFLAKQKGNVCSRREIMAYLNLIDEEISERTIDVHISNLRSKLGDSGNIIKNVRSVGYRLEQ